MYFRNLLQLIGRKARKLNIFRDAFDKHLIYTNITTSGALMVVGDIAQQEIEYQRGLQPFRYDLGRIGRMFAAGIAMGPMHHYFYMWLQTILPKRNPSSIIKKIILDQTIMSPACILAFFYTVGLMEGKSIKECTEEIEKKFITTYIVDWTLWPPTQYINFYYVPNKYQVIYINAITMLYNVFYSYIKHYDSLPIQPQQLGSSSNNILVQNGFKTSEVKIKQM